MSYYHGLISSRRANSLLNQRRDGSFLIRDSQSQPGNFVLSAKYKGRMYHVLVFQQGGKYVMDSTGLPEEESVEFSSLDELVLFLTGHNLKVGDDEVQLTEACPCVEDSTRKSSNVVSRVKDGDDTDLMTDIFASLFGTRSVTICVAHSSVNLGGELTQEDKSYWIVIVKDLEQKGYFIKIVDKEEKIVVREKKIGKQFQYDLPSDLLMTFLSEHGITCIGFGDTQEKDRFLHQVDRVVKLQQDRSIKLRNRTESEATVKQRPTEITHRIKASEFNVENLSEEWQYLFEQAGVTEAMLKDKASLQFILDTVYEIGGAPLKLPTLTSAPESSSASGDEKDAIEREREQAIILDENLKKESLRASRLSELLQKKSLKSTTPLQREHVCSFLAACERFKDHLVVKYSMIALGPENASCYCQKCAAGKPTIQVAGSPPQQFTLPVGWSQFMHSSQNHTLAQHFYKRWHVAYSCVPASRVASVMRTGQLIHSHSSGEVVLSPDIECACSLSNYTEGYHDSISGHHYNVCTVFQVCIQPGTYSVHVAEDQMDDSSSLHTKLEWRAKERTYIVHSLWISMDASP